ncbi:DNA-binding transcriptional regulator, LysR family [bacterium A37T11]|nr:DNA-binding transcriptional regulator, LysR family [bacterium A37T11]
MELRHLLYFKTVADELHFRKAAEKLFISQPPLSRQIRELEEELGVRLFSREHKQVRLTEAGKYFKTEVDSLLAHLQETKTIVKQINGHDSGELRIGYISSVYQPRLAEVLILMREVYPFVKTSLFEVPTRSQTEALENGSLDVGILRAPVPSKNLAVKSLFFDPFTVVVPAGVGFDSQISMATYLSGSPFIFFNKSFAPHYTDKLLDICNRLGFQPSIMHEANNVHSILQLVEAGMGVSILPASLEKQYAYLKLNFVPLQGIPINTEVVLAYKTSRLRPALKWFIEHYPL